MRHSGLSIEGISLSRRQVQCPEWVARGKTVAEVAQLLGIRQPTAKYHLDSAKAKLGIKNNVQAGIAFKRKKDD